MRSVATVAAEPLVTGELGHVLLPTELAVFALVDDEREIPRNV